MALALLVVAGADNGHQNAQDHADQQGDDCDQKGDA